MPYVGFKGEAVLEVGKEMLCGKVEVSAGCSHGPVNSPVKQHAVLLGVPVPSWRLSLLGLCE